MTSLTEQAFAAFNKRKDRAKYYEEQQNYQQALKEYADAFFQWNIAWKSLESIPGGQYSEQDEKILFLFSMGVLINSIVKNYSALNETRKSSFFAKILKEIMEILGGYKDSFEPGQIKVYEQLTASSIIREILTRNEEDINKEDLADAAFKEIRDNFNEICDLNICLLPSRSSCFIATAAYSTPTHPDLDTFRNFRDEKLLTNPVGKQLVNLYYQISPSIAQYVEKQPLIKNLLRHQLGRLAEWMRN